MNSQLETAIDIKSRSNETNPFILKIHANSTSQEHIQLSISSHILKKLSLIDIARSRQLADLYKQCLLHVVESPLLDLKSSQLIKELVYFLEYWQTSLGKAASWPHSRTCFYYLEDRLKKNRHFESLDYVRLKRAQLQPNKNEFLTQIMAESIHTQELRSYIVQLQQLAQDFSQKSSSPNPSLQPLHSQQFLTSRKLIVQIQQENQPKIKTNILYSDSVQDWKQISNSIHQIKNLSNLNPNEDALKLADDLSNLFETYLLQKLPVFINWMKSKEYPKDKILQELNFRRSIVQNLGNHQHTQILNVAISRITHNNNYF